MAIFHRSSSLKGWYSGVSSTVLPGVTLRLKGFTYQRPRQILFVWAILSVWVGRWQALSKSSMRTALQRLSRQAISSARGFSSVSYESALGAGETTAPLLASQTPTEIIDVRTDNCQPSTRSAQQR